MAWDGEPAFADTAAEPVDEAHTVVCEMCQRHIGLVRLRPDVPRPHGRCQACYELACLQTAMERWCGSLGDVQYGSVVRQLQHAAYFVEVNAGVNATQPTSRPRAAGSPLHSAEGRSASERPRAADAPALPSGHPPVPAPPSSPPIAPGPGEQATAAELVDEPALAGIAAEPVDEVHPAHGERYDPWLWTAEDEERWMRRQSR